MTTSWHDLQHEPITWEMFLDIDEDVRRDLEIVDGYVVPREQRSRDHQKVSTRLSLALETAAVQQMRKTGGAECYETNTEVDVLLWEVPPTARKPDAVLHRCIPDGEQLAAEHVLVAAEVLSTWSGRRDRVHKMSDYADAGIPHYWLVSFDKVGAVAIERYALAGGAGRYVHVGTSHRDMGPTAINISAPFPVEILWADLEVAPRVLLPGIWNDPATPQRERKRIARLLLADVTVTRTSDTITGHVRLAGGQHRTLAIPAPLPIGDQRRTPADVLAAIDELLDQHTTGEIAGILNQRGMASGTGEPFHRLIVDHIIRTYRLRSRRSRLRATGMLTLAETAAAHHVHPHTIKAWRRAGIVSAERYNDKGEHLYYPPDPGNPPNRPKIGRRPKTPDQPQR